MRPLLACLIGSMGLHLAASAQSLRVELDLAQPQGAIRDVFGVNRKPGFSTKPTQGAAANLDAANLYAAFGLSQVRLHDAGLDLCSTYTAATKLNTGVSPAQTVSGCELTGTGGIPTFTWTPTSSADADLNNTANYDFSGTDTALKEVASTGAATYLRLGESYNGPNNTADPVAWAKVATNIYQHVIGRFKPTAGVAAVDPVFVEVHNEPDGGFWRGTQADFYTLFRETVTRVRAAAQTAGKSLRIGGPGFTRSILTTSGVAGNPANGFIAGVGLSNLDFYSAHLYGSCDRASASESAAFLRNLRSLVNNQGGSSLPIHITEWNIGLGNQCGNAFFGEARTQSYASAVLTQFQDPAQNIEAAHFYAGVPIMALFDFSTTAGKARINPSAWAFWAHAQLRGGTQLSTQVCQSNCLAGYAAETLPLLALGAQRGERTLLVLTNDGSSAQSTTVRVKGLGSGRYQAVLRTPSNAVQELSVAGNPAKVDSTALQSLLASPAQETRSDLSPSAGVLELSTSVPARGLQVVELKPQARTLSEQADCLFSWGERQYASLFQPQPQVSKTAGDYYYRHYPTTNTYVGITLSGQRLVFWDANGSVGIQDLGALGTWLGTAGCQ
ncbi:MAG: hypothetical protein U1E77_14610 [Inhella sp.]